MRAEGLTCRATWPSSVYTSCHDDEEKTDEKSEEWSRAVQSLEELCHKPMWKLNYFNEEWHLLGCYAVWLVRTDVSEELTRATRRNIPEDTILLNYFNLPNNATSPAVDSASNRNEYQESFW
jgi:hypothetical protein